MESLRPGPANPFPFHTSQLRHRRPNDDHPDWRSYAFVRVFIKNLPENTQTVDVYGKFRAYGNVEKIVLHGTRAGRRVATAEVWFKPPPSRAPWLENEGQVKFKLPDCQPTTLFAHLDRQQPKNFKIYNHRLEAEMNEEVNLTATALDFGILTSAEEMMVGRSVQSSPDSEICLRLNLKLREMVLFFPLLLRSSNGDKIRSYKFPMALDERLKIVRITSEDKSVSYVFHLSRPPWYTRKLEQTIGQSHITDARSWREEDSWTRQTDIVDHKDHFTLVDQTPVGLRKNLNSINIARWTTFRVVTTDGQKIQEAEQVFKMGLEDFGNNRIFESSDFKVTREDHPLQAEYWNLIDRPKSTSSSQFLSMQLLDLTFDVRYQLEVCISQGWLSEYDIDQEFLAKLAAMSEHNAKQMLVHVDACGERIFHPLNIFNDVRFQKPVRARQLPRNCVSLMHVTVTATGLLLYTPCVEVSNRVIRKYQHHGNRFIRVRFEDDDYRGQTKLYASSNNKLTLILRRIKRTMEYGIIVAGRRYEFLAWGNSQLREHGCYFFATVEGALSASQIRAEMGEFDNEKVVAKRAARMGQCFSTTQAIHLRIPPITKANTIPDVAHGRYTFSDGVGKISVLAAQMVHSSLKSGGSVPSCFQFRLGGCKGILTVDPTMRGLDIKVRASQFKFDSSSQELEIIRTSQFWQPFLNRQLILVLSALGVRDDVFLKMQRATIDALNTAMDDENVALKTLRDNVDPNRMTLAICDLVSNGFQGAREPFVMALLHLWREWSLRYLKEKAKIPIAKGAFLLGTMDETGILRGHFDKLQPDPDATREEKEKSLPEIFLQITDPQTGKVRVIEGICILARNPSLHRGDIRVVKAIDVPPLRHIVDCVVTPQTGDRDLPSMCSGGDLDGDDYVVSWDENLIPSDWNAEPFHYDVPAPKTAPTHITTKHLIEFFCDYLQNDFLGRIAHAHLGAADYFIDGVESTECLELLHLHSMAVDYPKTGVPASLPRHLERTEWPHFMEKRSKSYKSHKVLGKLYDGVKNVDFKFSYEQQFDPRILNYHITDPKIKQDARALKDEYDLAMRRIMNQHKIRTEFEVWSTFVINHSKASKDFKFHEEIGQLSKALKDEFYAAIVQAVGGNTFEHLRVFAIAAYQLTAYEYDGVSLQRANIVDDDEKPELPFISFPWVLSDVLGKIASVSTLKPPTSVGDMPDVVFVNSGSSEGVLKDDGYDASSADAGLSESGGSIVSLEDLHSSSVDEATSELEIIGDGTKGKGIGTATDNATVLSGLDLFSGKLDTVTTITSKESSPIHVSQASSIGEFQVDSIATDDDDGAEQSGPMLSNGTLKDPASMTAEELEAMFGGDEDL
jgi:RNA-dependent RNA polymerase